MYSLVIAALIALAAFGAGWSFNGWRLDSKAQALELERTQEAAEATAESRRIEQRRGGMALEIGAKRDAQIRNINDRLVDALDELRQRPERSASSGVPSDPAACKGATGADLSAPDAGFLAREVARADTLRAALGECYERYDSLNVPAPN